MIVEHRPQTVKSVKIRNLEVGFSSDKGLVRSSNEDSTLTLDIGQDIVTDQRVCLYAVADGLGGYDGGKIASKTATKMLAKYISEQLIPIIKKENLGKIKQKSIRDILASGIKAANKVVYLHGQNKANNMATTLVTALIINNVAYIANIGDSRAYCIEGDHLRQITFDHSLVASLVSAGEIEQEEIYTHPQRNMVTRYLGSENEIEVDYFKELLSPGKSIVLCSDGLWEMIKDIDLRDIILERSHAQVTCDKLVEKAKENGGVDNISVIVINVVN